MRKLLATLVLVALVAGAFLAGKATKGSQAVATSTTSSSGGASTTRPSTVPASTSTSSPGTPRCSGGRIQTTIPSSAGAAGTVEATVRGVNLASTTCSLIGYPGVQLLGSVGGAALPTTVDHRGSFSDPRAKGAPALVTVAPGASFSFQMVYSNVPVGNQAQCPSSSGLAITWPGGQAVASVPYTATVCGGGAVHVSRVYAS